MKELIVWHILFSDYAERMYYMQEHVQGLMMYWEVCNELELLPLS